MIKKIFYILFSLTPIFYGCSDKNPTNNVDITNKLIISEIHFVSSESRFNWFEIYNPFTDTLSLVEYWRSGAMCSACLGREVKIKPKGFAIIAADSTKVQTSKCELVVSHSTLINLHYGGLIKIVTVGNAEGFSDVIRYGNPYWSTEYKLANGIDAVEYTNDNNKSYKRLLPYEAHKFKLTTPTPGY